MSLRKLCFYAMLATALAFPTAGGFNHYIKKSGAPETNAWPNASRLTTDLAVGSRALPAHFLPVQPKNAKSLAAGKVLVASRNLGDPHFAKAVILLVR